MCHKADSVVIIIIIIIIIIIVVVAAVLCIRISQFSDEQSILILSAGLCMVNTWVFEIFYLLRCYAPSIASYRRFGTTHGPIFKSCSETPVTASVRYVITQKSEDLIHTEAEA